VDTQLKGEARPAKRVKSVQWTDLSAERREPKRATGELSKSRAEPSAASLASLQRGKLF
jgi:hypothetical protein